MASLGFSIKDETMLSTMTMDVLKSSEIEGEILNYDQVRSSIARRLGMENASLVHADRNVEGVVEMMLDATPEIRRSFKSRPTFWVACIIVSNWLERNAQNRNRML